jgi:hypothetical protein
MLCRRRLLCESLADRVQLIDNGCVISVVIPVDQGDRNLGIADEAARRAMCRDGGTWLIITPGSRCGILQTKSTAHLRLGRTKAYIIRN